MILLAALSIVAASCIVVDGERVRASDLATAVPELAGNSSEIGHAPAPGAIRRVPPQELTRLAGVPISSGICLERRVQPLSAARISAAIESTVPGATVEVLDFLRSAVPSGELEFPPGGRSASGFWRGRLRYSASQSMPVWAKVRVTRQIDVLVADVPLKPGTTIEPAHVRQERRDVPPLAQEYLTQLDQAIGRMTRRRVSAGEPLHGGLLMDGFMVTRGDSVTVEAGSGLARVRFTAKAESSGRTGDSVVIQSPINGRRLRARVAEKGLVRL